MEVGEMRNLVIQCTLQYSIRDSPLGQRHRNWLFMREGCGRARERGRDKSDCFESASPFSRVRTRQWWQRQRNIGPVKSNEREHGKTKGKTV